ncbi:hypothetical protein HJTV-1_gp60 [Haloarcula virus HJTV-1]|uniref:Uncharacterized protein n=1 Tax=Halorubrum tailed virus 10 TaxID=2877991 RepID=A0AAE8XTE6_9CAUD|nr:hypothetical protein M1M36_gp074 [Halorubrum tailed virus 10]UBF19767.1 hypothetical protein HRTV-18_gp58 [Halorubrum virus HRTV-18]UBF19890.1 hypothetical protein HRTV-20_gp58 [Halorubrum virus HRTV-20]UBF20014.1 hypothetical protein HRTV-22_gp59 [Halorubrum virus HRTV-22]UBF20141.1 hypothetical protein HRTV-26_gp60 [Halorubrum virus HRTV-26]UBF21183.1 hypothetical protein HJTV-1_gp60 [Haloarcula virus HJTV-1]UFK26304.1 hypothetical protein [Hardygib1 virus]
MTDGITLDVEFTQRLTIYPPDEIEDGVDADYWFHNDPVEIIRDGIDLRQGSIEVLSINE